MKITPVIIAAGKGTRMHSKLPKVLHPILGRSLVEYAVGNAHKISETPPVVVIGKGADEVRRKITTEVQFVVQKEQLGTGHAVQQAESLLKGKTDLVLVVYGDMPLVRPETLQRLIDCQKTNTGPITMLTVELDDPHGFGRVVRDENGAVLGIVEEVQATPEQLAIRELNAGMYCFSSEWLWNALSQIELSPKGEYFLTDLAGIAAADGKTIETIQLDDPDELVGINTRVHLAEASAIMQRRINIELMEAGVSIVDPTSTYIEPDILVGPDTVIWPNTYLQGKTNIGAACVIGPNSIIRDSKIGNQCEILYSVVESAVLEDQVDVGPYGHLRKGAHLAEGVHMGNYGEVKNSYLGPGTKMGHFSYLGDATIGPNVNIGAGTITCNYDGSQKHPTVIGADVFIGSDSMLVAPLNIEDGARTGAGSVVTKNVPKNTLVVGIPARAIRKLKKDQPKE